MLIVTYFFLIVVCHPGAYEGHPSMSAYDTEQESASIHGTHAHMDAWLGTYNTPPPYPTQASQYDDDDGSLIHGRPVNQPDRLGWTTPNPGPPRLIRRRRP